MKQLFSATTFFLLAGFAWSQAPRWRVVEMPSQRPDEDIVQQVSDNGDILFSQAGVAHGIRRASGQIVYAPNGFSTRTFLENGLVYGKYNYDVATWDPLTGAIQQMQRSPWDPPTLNYYVEPSSSTGGLVASRSDGIPGGQSYLYLMSPNGPPSLIAGWQNFYGIASTDPDGTMVGFVDGPSSGLAGTPAIWSPGGRSFVRLGAPQMRRGNAYFRNALEETFGVISRSGPEAGWYGVWWQADGTVSREEKFANLYGTNTSNRAYSQVTRAGSDSVIFAAARGADAYQKAYLWSPFTGVVRLESRVEGLPVGFEIVHSMNGSVGGRIAIAIRNPSNPVDYRWNYYLEPVPEPATLAGLALGLGWLARRRKHSR